MNYVPKPLLPVNIIPGSWVYRDFKVEPAIDHPFTRSLPWQTIPYFTARIW